MENQQRIVRSERPVSVPPIAINLAKPLLVVAVVLGGAGLLLSSYVLSPYSLSLAIEFVIFAMLAMSLNLLMGYAGLVSFGHAAFFGLGGYSAAYAATLLSPNILITVPLVLVVSGLGAALIGALSLRARGIYFLMVTLAFAQMLHGFALKWTGITGGSDGLPGIPRPTLELPGLSLSFSSNVAFYQLVVVLFVAVWWILKRVVRSPFGSVLQGFRENESRLRALGYNTQAYALGAFIGAGMIAGLSGALFTQFNWHASPDSLFYIISGQALIMVIIGGIGTLSGPIVGAALVRGLPVFASAYTARWQMVIGLVFVAFVLFAQGGIAGLMQQVWWKVRALNGRR